MIRHTTKSDSFLIRQLAFDLKETSTVYSPCRQHRQHEMDALSSRWRRGSMGGWGEGGRREGGLGNAACCFDDSNDYIAMLDACKVDK